MASRQARPAATPSTRQNEYFVPRDGIDREVISADICRYLGNDALVRPGVYTNEQGVQTQGYYITAYRNLTTAMIEDLKADSSRWDNERRAQTSRNMSGGSFTSRKQDGPRAPNPSNSPIVHYHQSETHQSRQQFGPTTEGPHRQQGSHDAGHDRRYPGSGAPGYSGAPQRDYRQPSPQQPQQPQSYGGNNPGYGGYQQQQPSAVPDRFTSPGNAPMAPPPGHQEPYISMGAHRFAGSSNDQYSSRSSAAPPAQPVYASAPPSQPGYAATSYGYTQPPSTGAPGYGNTMHPQDPFMGRGASLRVTKSATPDGSDFLASPAGQTAPQQQGYSPQHQQQHSSSSTGHYPNNRR